MADKQALSVKAFGGVNKLHTRELGQVSDGKNFWTRNGVLITREGCSLLASTPFTGYIRSVHGTGVAQITPRLLVEERMSGSADETFDDPARSQRVWTVTFQGGAGTQQYSQGESILAPEQNAINSVSMRARGNFTSVKVRARLASDGANPTKYADICIGSGDVTGLDGPGQWYHTVLSNGYVMSCQTEGSASGLIFWKMVNGTSVYLGEGQAPADWTTQYHDYEIRIDSGTVSFLVDGQTIASYSDTTYTGGDILISQGEYSNGAGAILHIDNVSSTPSIYGNRLWRYNSLDWLQLLSDVSGNGFSSTMYYDHLILVKGFQKYAYDVAGDSIAPLQNLEGGNVPNMEFITVHKDILFGWAPHFAPTDTIHFNGYEKDANGKILGRSKDSWPPDFAIRVPDPSGSPVLACIPVGTHLLVLTGRSYWLIYGDNEDNFSLTPGGAIGVYNERCVAKVGDYAIWLGEDNHGIKRVYAYTGTQPYVISQQAEELINDLPASAFANVRAYGFGTKFWLILPNTISNTMKAFVFDVEEKQWYIHEFPAAFMCACLHGFFDEKRIYFGANDARVICATPVP